MLSYFKSYIIKNTTGTISSVAMPLHSGLMLGGGRVVVPHVGGGWGVRGCRNTTGRIIWRLPIGGFCPEGVPDRGCFVLGLGLSYNR